MVLVQQLEVDNEEINIGGWKDGDCYVVLNYLVKLSFIGEIVLVIKEFVVIGGEVEK